jgi:interferon-induced transmembrane protein/uncharacterized protein DUF4339
MYHVIGTDKFEYGPIDAGQIHEWIREGRVTEQTLVRESDGNQWKLLSEIPEFAAALGTRPRPPVTSSARSVSPAVPVQVPNYLVPAILTTLFCCTPLGIPAIFYSVRVNSRLNSGDVEGARAASEKARLWCWICVVAGVLSVVISIWMYKNYVAERLKF